MTATFRRLVRHNATRLLNDARILQESGSHPSATALAIYSLEESGKFLVDRWKEEGFRFKIGKKQQLHKEKQLAIASIFAALTAAEAIFEFLGGTYSDSAIGQFQDVLSQEPSQDFVEHVAKALHESKRAQLMDSAIIGAIEGAKHIALYVDRSWIRKKFIYSQIDLTDSTRFIDNAEKALDLLDNKQLDRVARAVLSSHLEQHQRRGTA